MEQYYKFEIRNFHSVPPPCIYVNLNNNYISSSLSPIPIFPNNIQTPIIPFIPNNSNINYPNNNLPYFNPSYPNPLQFYNNNKSNTIPTPNFNYIRSIIFNNFDFSMS
jgi:hypothetical protein